MPSVPRVPGLDGRQLRWEGHNEERRLHVLNAAVELLEEQPLGSELRVQQIAERAGLVRTVVYRLFSNRIDLYREIQQHIVGMIREQLDSTLVLSGSIEQIVGGVVGGYVSWVADHPQLHEMAQRALGDGQPGQLDLAVDALGNDIAAVFQAGAIMLGHELDEDQMTTLDVLVVGLIGQVRGSVNQWVRRPDPKLSPRALAKMLSRWIWFQIDGQAREIGVELDPTVPVDEMAAGS
ncbi:TetR/AcrR family transcriptional regulator [Nocardioides humilatus]|uniref:TetR/AcrR family transcriptional regulator n=1 Tax=Nocardioides humilatus TaxID=2607660 RepID=A0A5B1LMH2_9ACTN|nr:TetR/AcrR family transcriptional regulator [Nocardioides humilatus]KAA1421714.1 TetR/AcrR family transcriptional regulator [Nocardioides humilatus]